MDFEDLQNIGIELIKIDVTQYLIDTLTLPKTRIKFDDGLFEIELEDSENPSVSNNLINYRITGDTSGNEVYNLEAEFYHDFTYQDKDPDTGEVTYHVTECVFNWKEIEQKIMTIL